MTELDQARPEHDDPARDERAPDRDRGHGEASTQAALKYEDQLPARQDARAATWDEDPEYDDNGTAAKEYEGDLDALTPDDQLPARQDARAAAWDEDADYDHEDDPAAQYDGDLDAITAGYDQLPARQDARAATWDDHPVYHDEGSPDIPDDAGADDHVLDSDQDDLDQTAVGQGAPETGRPADTSERITGVEAENARLGQTITDLQARLERLEQGSQTEPSHRLTGQERDTAQKDAIEADNRQARPWRRPTDEALALGAAATGGVITTVADFVPYLHADVAGVAASAIAVGAAAVTWMRTRGEAGHANRRED